MRNLITVLFSFILLSPLINYGQSKKGEFFKKNELKIDAFDLTIFTALEINYERVQNNEFGYGVSFFINFKSEDTYYEKFAFVPYVRYYFTSSEDFGAKGFFVEAFSKLAQGDADLIGILSSKKDEYFDVSLGLAVGRKWVSHRGFVLETSWGVGRNFGTASNSPQFVFRGGVSLGYRF